MFFFVENVFLLKNNWLRNDNVDSNLIECVECVIFIFVYFEKDIWYSEENKDKI